MPEMYFYCHPWDLIDDGLDETIIRLAGDIGVESLSVSACHGRIEQFRPRYQQPWIRREAAVSFQPNIRHYGRSQIRPVPGAWMKSRNALDQIARSCERHGVSLRARVVCCSGETLAARHRMAACVDVFGEASSTWLCPSGPDVREYVAGLIADLSENYPLNSIELEDFDFGAEPFASAGCERGIVWGRLERFLGSLCFCAACRQRAFDRGIDAEAVARSVRDRLRSVCGLNPIEFETPEALVEADPDLRAWVDMRRECVTSLLRSVRGIRQGRLALHVAGEPLIRGANAAAMIEHGDALICPPLSAPGESPERYLRTLTAEMGSARRIDVPVYCHPPGMPDPSALVRTVQQLSQAGHPSIGFSSYGMSPAPCLGWVRQAIRYARRESAGG